MATQLTDNEKLAGFQTQKHIKNVTVFLNIIIKQLLHRAQQHDKSKLQSPQIQVFTQYTTKLKDMEYNSQQYKDCLVQMSAALNHHYANNRHHPQHFNNGIDGMNIIDIIQMFAD